ncbi:hypothetical protein [Streptomyces olivaceus]
MKAEDLESTTVYNYRVTLDRVRGKLGNVRLQELTEDHVVAWMRWALQGGRVRGGKAGTGLGVTSVDMSLARLEDALNRAVTRGLVTVNVASEVHIPLKARKTERKTKEVVQPWNASEVGAFVAAMKSDRLFAPLLLSLTGLRPARSAACGGRTSTWTRPRSASPTPGPRWATARWWRRTRRAWRGSACCRSRTSYGRR